MSPFSASMPTMPYPFRMLYGTSWSPKLPPIRTARILLLSRGESSLTSSVAEGIARSLAWVYEYLAVIPGSEPDVAVLCVYAHDAVSVADVVCHIVVAEVAAYLYRPYLSV